MRKLENAAAIFRILDFLEFSNFSTGRASARHMRPGIGHGRPQSGRVKLED
jgi:hypothetical protein